MIVLNEEDDMRDVIGIGGSIVLGLVLLAPVARSEEKDKDKDKLDLDKIPKKVMDALKAKFPKAKIHKWEKGKEGDKVVYDIEFTQDGLNFEADIFEDGKIHNWEKEIKAKDLPKAVTEAVEKKYPKGKITLVMEITAVKDGKDEREGYEIILDLGDKKEVEVTVSPEGKILEDSGEKKKEEKK
jgi:hypothetical protein